MNNKEFPLHCTALMQYLPQGKTLAADMKMFAVLYFHSPKTCENKGKQIYLNMCIIRIRVSCISRVNFNKLKTS